MKILVINFSRCFRFFSSDLRKFKLETKVKTLAHIVDEKQVGTKDAIAIILSLNASQKLLMSGMLKGTLMQI